jgi:hypothetical protein
MVTFTVKFIKRLSRATQDRYSTARDCCAADASVGRLLTRAVLCRYHNITWPDLTLSLVFRLVA